MLKPITAIILSAIGLAYFAPANANPGCVEVCSASGGIGDRTFGGGGGGTTTYTPMCKPAFSVKKSDIKPIPEGGCPQPCSLPEFIPDNMSTNFKCEGGEDPSTWICHADAIADKYILMRVGTNLTLIHSPLGEPHCTGDGVCDIFDVDPTKGCPPYEPPCEGDECPCEGDDCPPPPCEGPDCPCEGDDCPPPPCEGDECNPPTNAYNVPSAPLLRWPQEVIKWLVQ